MSLQISVVAGRDLIPKNKKGSADPYVTVSLLGKKTQQQKGKTKTQKHTLDPVWNESFTIKIEDAEKQAVHFTCWDWNSFSKDEFMGQVTLTIRQIASEHQVVDRWYNLLTNEKGEVVSGAIHLVLDLNLPDNYVGNTVIGRLSASMLSDSSFSLSGAPSGNSNLTSAQFILLEAEDDPTGKSIHELFDIGEKIGSGAFAIVKVATSKKTNRHYAVKILNASNTTQNPDKEIAIMQKVDHPNIIRLYSIFQEENQIYMVMELVTGGELFDKIVQKGHYTETDAAVLVRKIVDAIAYLHSIGIAHRDLKPENLLLQSEDQDTEVKIADFGLSKIMDHQAMMKTACGTPGYVAPEVLQAQGYGPEVDMWSIGVITYILLCGFPPFYSDELPELFKKIMAVDYSFPATYWKDISEDAKDFIRALLVSNPKTRLTAAKALQHVWLNKTRKNIPLNSSVYLKSSLAFHRSRPPPT